MLARGGFVIVTLVILIADGYWVEGRAVPHHRRRGEGVTRLHNVTLNNATLVPAMAAGGELVLHGYRIERFGKDMFDLLSRTASLTLRKGSIPNVFFYSHTLDSFQIDSTGLETFDLDPFELPNLRILQITRNSLELITPRISYLTGLRSLDLSQNRLTHVKLSLFEPMRQLRDLDLSVNRIVRIAATENPEQPLTVRNLWISYNRLELFDEFPEAFPSLETMRLHGNDWSCPWVDWARGEIMRKGITVFGADYDCSGDRRGGLCCYDGLRTTTETGQPVDAPTLIIENEPNGTIGVKFGEVEIFY
ncbi:immunoglobulin superfamily member 10-like [Anopheles ziemanni]|uniref:immunoglobulin superfamily member 10-like n=1 Tax=Anopheles coustani TaxID=139045 RepID=UPI0026582846|nr:immunoglobulin superfamily member 10-like [Anopheles coustani]XP_058169758.1 immunoglobulin superfamily member 10-like [Anopheles ziemanni]